MAPIRAVLHLDAGTGIEITGLFGKVDYDSGYDYKAGRKRN